MQLVQFSGADPFVLDDVVAEALLELARELARYREHDLVRLRARDVVGDLVTVTLLLGPGTHLSTRTTGGEAVGDDGADDLRRRAARLRAWPHEVLGDPLRDEPGQVIRAAG